MFADASTGPSDKPAPVAVKVDMVLEDGSSRGAKVGLTCPRGKVTMSESQSNEAAGNNWESDQAEIDCDCKREWMTQEIEPISLWVSSSFQCLPLVPDAVTKGRPFFAHYDPTHQDPDDVMLRGGHALEHSSWYIQSSRSVKTEVCTITPSDLSPRLFMIRIYPWSVVVVVVFSTRTICIIILIKVCCDFKRIDRSGSADIIIQHIRAIY